MTSTVVAASVVILDDAGRVVLIKRGHAPAEGLWSLPGGGVRRGETARQAASREALEETGLLVAIGVELFVVTVELAPGVDYEIHGFLADAFSGDLRAGDDAAEASWVDYETYQTLKTTPRLTELLESAGWPPLDSQ